MWAAISYRNELHRVPARVWLGTKREYVHGAPILLLYMYTTYVGLCERDTNLERYSVWVLESFFVGGSIKKFNICNVCEIESWIYHIYRGGDPREETGGIIDLRCP